MHSRRRSDCVARRINLVVGRLLLRLASRRSLPYDARPHDGISQEVSHATQERTPRRRVLSRSQVREGRGSHRRRASSVEPAWWEASRSSMRSSVGTTRAPACQTADFKNCCMLTGEFDGSDRHHFFQRVRRRLTVGASRECRTPSTDVRTPFGCARGCRLVPRWAAAQPGHQASRETAP